jgi:hypothetical protein
VEGKGVDEEAVEDAEMLGEGWMFRLALPVRRAQVVVVTLLHSVTFRPPPARQQSIVQYTLIELRFRLSAVGAN